MYFPVYISKYNLLFVFSLNPLNHHFHWTSICLFSSNLSLPGWQPGWQPSSFDIQIPHSLSSLICLFGATYADVPFIIGDWNAKEGNQEKPGVTGKFGLGTWNEAGQRLIEFCQENALVVANTLFQQHKRRLYTWTSLDGHHHHLTLSVKELTYSSN